ncbi:Putative protein in type-1 retrotransposable element R1DM [Araneus ventricosus]|uniref:Reverse transcriptase domain-containing protein n=1 Tax=Araneus ventricosus TaxID=182803 RepID=A0A4Y2MI67_ARAVE|nr:Putative protein in type-1 retrotransposable element R1DM [Araneus ventricosus]
MVAKFVSKTHFVISRCKINLFLMALISDGLNSLTNITFIEQMKETLESGDPVVRKWTMVHTNFLPFLYSFLYVMLVTKIGPALMKNKKPFDLRYLMIAYNFALVTIYFVCVSLLLYIFLTTDAYSKICYPAEIKRYHYTYYVKRKIKATRNLGELNNATIELHTLIINACNKSFKIKKQLLITKPNWWTEQLEIHKKKVRALRRRAQRAPEIERQARYQVFKKEKAKYRRHIKQAKNMGWRKFCSAASHPYGKQYKAVFQKSVFPSQIPYLINGDPKGSLQEAPQNILDQIFLSPAIPTNYNLTTSTQPPDPPFFPQEISAVIEHLLSGKAPVIDGIDNLLIKIIYKRFNNIFPTLFNKCLHLSCFLDSLKIGNIILFQKGGKDQRLVSSYRPISLLPTVGKVLEKLMTQRLTYHLESTNSLNDRQHDFREGKSVDTAINELLSKIQTARRDGKHVLVLSIDVKEAIDNLQHRAILKSLDASACPVNINRLFHSLLQNRKMTLLTPQGRATKDKKQGCPQGSCSGRPCGTS